MSAKQQTNKYAALRYSVQEACQRGALWVGLALLLLLSGCSKRYDDMPAYLPLPMSGFSNESVGRFKTSFIAEQIDSYYRGVNPGPIAIATFVNLDDLYRTSSFGRMLSEQVMSELAMRGFDVIELRHSDALQFLETSGELALSRDIGVVRHERQLGGVVVGTYVVSPIRVYVNARLIDPSTSLILSAGSVEMAKTDEIARLLRGGGMAPSLERIPVRHLGFGSYPAMAYSSPMSRAWDLEESTGPAAARNDFTLPSNMHRSGSRAGGQRGDTATAVEPKLPPAEEKKKE